nr:MAG TPA: hypothetical protein [Caudoviricetes sp.]
MRFLFYLCLFFVISYFPLLKQYPTYISVFETICVLRVTFFLLV